MTVIGLDDTDSRERGMCTTFVAHRIAERLRECEVDVERLLLVRLNPAVEHKTRGNAALAIHADVDPNFAFEVACEAIEDAAAVGDENTNPGVVVAPTKDIPEAVTEFAARAVTELLDLGEAESLIAAHNYLSAGWKHGRGKIGALAAVGAWEAFDDWTSEQISYRESDRWGTERDVDAESVFEAADEAYPRAWDTVDRVEGDMVCVPHTPGPILHGIRGDDPDTVRAVANSIASERVASRELFTTNQGTDVHLQDGKLGSLEDGRAYRVTSEVASAPETRRGGHVFFDLEDGDSTIQCAAFEPTKRFRDRVRALRPGDRITACGEVKDGTLKLEKFAVRDLNEAELVNPTCGKCGRRMKSAGANQGYRCRDCGTSAPGKVEQPVERDLEEGWYEVPPCARRHIAKPLVRGGFDAPTHPEK